ncbi:uncharacterized protein LOC121994445 [Zingiber officinale]|uniref:uncharacterized protein LOC121994445 n=1 Tax=Zingiber officinale TaxID=94328 RepID=UPI001C4AD8E5|nr:uncharacterized protein LOC121994445 [Zingiber officinale]
METLDLKESLSVLPEPETFSQNLTFLSSSRDGDPSRAKTKLRLHLRRPASTSHRGFFTDSKSPCRRELVDRRKGSNLEFGVTAENPRSLFLSFGCKCKQTVGFLVPNLIHARAGLYSMLCRIGRMDLGFKMAVRTPELCHSDYAKPPLKH